MKELHIELRDIDQVHPYDGNVKKHPPEQIAKIAQSIKQFGWDQPIVVDKDGVIIKGHGRRLAAIELGLNKVPVLVRNDLDNDQVRAARLADNRVAMSDIDIEALHVEMEGLNEILAGIFDEKELDFFNADLGSMNEDAFIQDMEQAVDAQKKTHEQAEEAAGKERVSLAKVFGFKEIAAANMLAVSRFMAAIEEQTKLRGEDALVAFAHAWIKE